MRVTGIGQDELAATIGQSPRSIALWLTGVRLPSAASLKALSRTFGVPADWLLGADAVEIARGSRGSRRSPRRRRPRPRAQIRRRTKGSGGLSIFEREFNVNTDCEWTYHSKATVTGSKMNKIKFGTTVEVATPDRIKELRSKNPESMRSTGEAIDYLTVMFTGLTPRVAEAMDKACQKELQLTAQEMRHLSSDGSEELSVAELERDYDQFLRLHEHFSLYYMDVAENEPRDMRRIDLATMISPSSHRPGY